MDADGRRACHVDIEDAVRVNTAFRRVVWTDPAGKQQLVVMCVTPEDGEIGSEVHPDTTQLLRVEDGFGVAVLGAGAHEVTAALFPGALVIVPAGTRHNIINNNAELPLQLYTVYSPPHHAPGTVHARRADAIRAERV